MCGIFGLIKRLGLNLGEEEMRKIREWAMKIKHRGPDETREILVNDDFYGVFHRLSINGLDPKNGQPMEIDDCVLLCNGEIYNAPFWKKYYSEKYKTDSDCESIIHLYKDMGIEQTLKKLDGVFAFILYDKVKNKIFVARDPIGIRGLFTGFSGDGSLAFASEAKALGFCNKITQFPPGHYWDVYESENPVKWWSVYDLKVDRSLLKYETFVYKKIHDLLIEAVNKRLLSDRPIGCLLSGGVDSTLVCCILNKLIKEKNPERKLRTYAIGIEGSVDLEWAEKAAKQIGTEHYSVELTESQFLGAIRETIYKIESYCTTTVRASVGNYLISKFIKETTDDTVIFCGDVSDELFGSYRGFMKAPNSDDFFRANQKMIDEICFFDVLRSDRSISGPGLEARVPFADKDFMTFVMRIPPEFKMFNDVQIEKHILRQAFDGYVPISNDILWRRKEAFSDGVSSQTRGWYQIIREYVEPLIDEKELEQFKDHNLEPYDKESLYYWKIFKELFGESLQPIPHYWRHPFNNQKDPSARLLSFYKS